MKTSSLDLLEKSQLPPAQARAILRVMESELSLHDMALATKSDLHDMARATKSDLHDMALAAKSDLHDLELKVEALRGDLIGEIKGTIRWNFAFWIAQLAAIAGILKLLR